MKKLFLYISGILPFFFTSCEEDITLDVPPYEPKLAVYCILYPDSLPTLFLNRSRAYFNYSDNSREAQYIDNAQVIIEDLDTHTADTLMATSGNIVFDNGVETLMHYYIGKHRTKQGGRYKLTVNYNDKQVTGETAIPSPVTMDASRITHETDTVYDYHIEHRFTLRIPDPAGQENLYRIRTYIPQQDWDPQTGQVIWVERPSHDYYPSFRSDRGKDGEEVEYEYVHYGYVGGSEPDTLSIAFEVENYERSAGEYVESVYEQQYSEGDPFVEPVIIKHNVEGGLGVFGAAVLGNRTRIKLK